MAHDPLDIAGIEDELQDEERLVRDSVARFVDDEVLPIIGRCFAEHSFPRELVAPMARLGLLGSSLEGYGCAGLNAVSYGLICRELERGDSALRSFVSVQSSLCMFPIHTYGSPEQRERWLPGMARGEIIGCFGLTEAHGGSDPLNMNTTAKRQGGDWVLNGSKMWITNAPLADVAVVWALTEEGVRGFLVERGMRGFSAVEIERKMSLRASATGALYFDEVRVPEANLLPGSSVGLKAPLSCLTQARFGIAWGVMGAAQACLSEALHYTRERVLFGRPLAATQAVQIRLAEMARRISTGEVLALHMARRKDRGTLSPVQVSLAKWNNCRAAIDVARDARDLLGGAGITTDHGAIRHALNLESVITYEGTETIHQLSLGRELTGLNAF
ncbi:MAG: acyl-CoA dehydrogenase [Gammaproteobacteria bacterium]|nr:acyl-CoA dehydrogenase [Gammaproteobacteria bacterium]